MTTKDTPRPGQTQEQFRSYLAGRHAPAIPDHIQLYCITMASARGDIHIWQAAATVEAAIDRVWSSGRMTGNVRATVQRFQYVLALDRKDAYATVINRNRYKAFLIDPLGNEEGMLHDIPFNARVKRAEATRTLEEFLRALGESGWYITEDKNGLHRVSLDGRHYSGSRSDTRNRLAAHVANRYRLEPK